MKYKQNRTGKLSYDDKPDNQDKKKPIFCFANISKKTDKTIKLVRDKNDSHEFLKKIATLSTFTWEEIRRENRTGHGYELLDFKFIKGQNWMKEDIKNSSGNEKVMVFRGKPNTKSRILGYRHGQVFKIYCYDADGETYDHGS